MKPNPIWLTLDHSVLEAARLMRDQNIGFVPVCDGDGRPVGALTDRDIAVRVVANQLPIDLKVAEVMTDDVVACREADDVSRAEALMQENLTSRVVVVDDRGRPSGVISLSDISSLPDLTAACVILGRLAEFRGAHP